jgi:hypothetical protein
VGSSARGSLLEIGLERLRWQRTVVVGRPGAAGRDLILRPGAVRLLGLLAEPLMLGRGRVRLRLDRFLPRGFLARRGGRRCNKRGQD